MTVVLLFTIKCACACFKCRKNELKILNSARNLLKLVLEFTPKRLTEAVAWLDDFLPMTWNKNNLGIGSSPSWQRIQFCWIHGYWHFWMSLQKTRVSDQWIFGSAWLRFAMYNRNVALKSCCLERFGYSFINSEPLSVFCEGSAIRGHLR